MWNKTHLAEIFELWSRGSPVLCPYFLLQTLKTDLRALLYEKERVIHFYYKKNEHNIQQLTRDN